MQKLALLVLAFPLLAAGQANTMRLDYYHSGNAGTEMFSVDRVVIEPLPFSGNLARPVDETLRGKYAFKVTEIDSGRVIWSRSFSSIYGEWETTGEARAMNRTFHESLRFPAPETTVRISLEKRAADNSFEQIWQTDVDPQDFLVHRERAIYADDVVAIENNGDPATKVDLLLLGDGYTVGEREDFLSRARQLTDKLFATSPFRERRKDFNVWALAPAAAESGVSRPSSGLFRESPVGATYDAFRSERYVLTEDNRNWRRIASSTPYDFVEILTNSETYGGGGIYGLFSTAAANNAYADYLFIHEFAHHFAGLADEYYTSSVAYEPPEAIVEPYEPNVTALLDPDNLKWKHLVAGNTPLPTPWPKEEFEAHSIAVQEQRRAMRAANVPEADMTRLFRDNQETVEGMFSRAPHANDIGAFEGANYQARGYYRSEQNCIMFTRTEHFCTVCRAAIEAVIDEYTQTD